MRYVVTSFCRCGRVERTNYDAALGRQWVEAQALRAHGKPATKPGIFGIAEPEVRGEGACRDCGRRVREHSIDTDFGDHAVTV